MTPCRARRRSIVVAIAVLCAASPSLCVAQYAEPRRIEIGAAVGAINLNTITGEKPFALSARVGYRWAPTFGLELDVTSCPEDPSNNYCQLLIVAGPKAGVRLGPVDALGRLRAGAIRFDGGAFVALNGRARTEPAIDAGATFELNMSPRVALRLDFGRTIVPMGDEPVARALPPYSRVLGTTVNPHGSFGVQFRF